MVDKASRDQRAGSRLGDASGISVPRHELEFISKVGRLDRDEALTLLQKHSGNREAVFSELMARLKKR